MNKHVTLVLALAGFVVSGLLYFLTKPNYYFNEKSISVREVEIDASLKYLQEISRKPEVVQPVARMKDLLVEIKDLETIYFEAAKRSAPQIRIPADELVLQYIKLLDGLDEQYALAKPYISNHPAAVIKMIEEIELVVWSYHRERGLEFNTISEKASEKRKQLLDKLHPVTTPLVPYLDAEELLLKVSGIVDFRLKYLKVGLTVTPELVHEARVQAVQDILVEKFKSFVR